MDCILSKPLGLKISADKKELAINKAGSKAQVPAVLGCPIIN